MSGRRWIAVAVLVLVVLPVLWGASPLGRVVIGVVQAAHEAGPWGAVVFALAFGVAAVLAVPASFGQMTAGFLYGPVAGVLVSWACSVVFATVDFVLARTVLQRRVVGGWTDSDLWQRLDGHLATRGLGWVVLLRLSPMSPFHVVSYALGCTSVGLVPFVLGTAVGAVPPVLLYTLLGAGITDLARLAEGQAPTGSSLYVVLGLTLVASAGLSWRVRRALQAIAADATPSG
ncbi:MAG: TVP38/TMEM64 family protein [Alphaproteobacteria bacterium]|nr:TVP38/TMEM64 family protein [Alphaproteobacteria bacterium]